MPSRIGRAVRKTVYTMARRPSGTTPATRATRATRTTTTTADVPATTTTAATVADVPAADVPAADPTPAIDPIDARIAETFPGNVSGTIRFIAVMARAFAAVAGMSVATMDDRIAVRAAIVAALHAAYPGTVNTGVRNTGMFGGMHVFESQNAMYVAAAMSGAYVTDGHFVAAWSAELPNARCPFLVKTGYPTSTLSEYVGGRHNAVPGVENARAVVVAWMNAKRNRPTPAA